MKATFLLIGCVLLTGTLNAQSGFKPKYYFTVNTGMQMGKEARYSPNFTVRTVHGVILADGLRVGAGIGVDSYADLMAMPMFGVISYDLAGSSNAFFIEVSYGGSHVWRPMYSEWFMQEVRGGKMLSPALGYRIATGNLRAYVTLGYKYQCSTTHYSAGEWYEASTEQHFNRFVATIGIGWR